jgi:hypothetical protein
MNQRYEMVTEVVGEREVNKLLDEGWVLLGEPGYEPYTSVGSGHGFVYSLGKPVDDE